MLMRELITVTAKAAVAARLRIAAARTGHTGASHLETLPECGLVLQLGNEPRATGYIVVHYYRRQTGAAFPPGDCNIQIAGGDLKHGGCPFENRKCQRIGKPLRLDATDMTCRKVELNDVSHELMA